MSSHSDKVSSQVQLGFLPSVYLESLHYAAAYSWNFPLLSPVMYYYIVFISL